MSTTKTITLPVKLWDKIMKILASKTDIGEQSIPDALATVLEYTEPNE